MGVQAGMRCLLAGSDQEMVLCAQVSPPGAGSLGPGGCAPQSPPSRASARLLVVPQSWAWRPDARHHVCP